MSTRWRILDLVDFMWAIDVDTYRVIINRQDVVMSDVVCSLTGRTPPLLHGQEDQLGY